MRATAAHALVSLAASSDSDKADAARSSCCCVVVDVVDDDDDDDNDDGEGCFPPRSFPPIHGAILTARERGAAGQGSKGSRRAGAGR
eukprot:2247184-Rhodomonas_salina.1